MDKLIDFTSKVWNDYSIIIKYKRSKFRLLVEELSEANQQLLKTYDSNKYMVSGTAFLTGRKIKPDSLFLKFSDYGIPVRLIDHKFRKTEYVTYAYYGKNGTKFIDVQRNGFLVYCAPTGQGKTYFALNNLKHLESQFDTILYINLELSIDDIMTRCKTMNIDIPKNLYVAPLENVEIIEEWSEGKGRMCFIIDNIDNLVGGGDDAFGEQLEFIKKLDRFLKDYNHHALVLTQLVKEANLNLLGKDGEINDGITTNILSGVKQLSFLSRSVMMTAYSPELDRYVYKFLKVGSAKI